mgnify:FL=1
MFYKIAKNVFTNIKNSMNTITNLQMNNSNNITSFKGFGIKGLKGFKSAAQFGNKLPQELKGLEQKYFKEYSLMDKVLIKLNLKKDNSAAMAVFDSLGMEPKRYKNGSISVKKFGTYEQDFIHDMGLNENKLFKTISTVRGNAEFDKNSQITSLGNLEDISGNLYLRDSKINDVGNLNYVGRHVYLNEHLNKENFDNVHVFGCILD